MLWSFQRLDESAVHLYLLNNLLAEDYLMLLFYQENLRSVLLLVPDLSESDNDRERADLT